MSLKNYHPAAVSSERRIATNERRFAPKMVVWEMQIVVFTKSKKARRNEDKFV
jgi:hypothetical protein